MSPSALSAEASVSGSCPVRETSRWLRHRGSQPLSAAVDSTWVRERCTQQLRRVELDHQWVRLDGLGHRMIRLRMRSKPGYLHAISGWGCAAPSP